MFSSSVQGQALLNNTSRTFAIKVRSSGARPWYETTKSRKTKTGIRRYLFSNRISNNIISIATKAGGKEQAMEGVDLYRNGKKRVVITGIGAITALGNDVDEFYEKLLKGESAIKPITKFDCSEISTKFAGEIRDFDGCDGLVHTRMVKRADPYISFMIAAAKKALIGAKLSPVDGSDTKEEFDKLNKARCGCVIGSAMGGMHSFQQANYELWTPGRGSKNMNPFCIPFAITNMGSALVAMDLKFMGPNYSIAAACATGNFCMMNAMNHIRNGECDLCLAGASDAAVLSSGIAGFAASKALSTRNDDPEGASRPWDKNRDGFVMGEGAGVLCLESLESALARNAPILAEILGGAATCDAHHMTEPLPNGNGVRLAINRALKTSNVLGEDVNYINAHATSTPAGDLAELRTITDIFGNNKELKINSTKSLIGHLLGAASAVEAVAVIKAITTGELHPNKNLDDPDEGVRTDLLVGTTREKLKVKVALSNSFGFGGHNSAVLFSAYHPKANTYARA